MLALLLFLLVLLLLFSFAFVLAEQWEKVRRQLLVKILILLTLMGGGLFGIRYWLVRPITCIPHCVGASLVSIDLSGLPLTGATFVEANLTGAILAKAQLRGADFSGADLVRANLESANLEKASLLGANLQDANLAGAILIGADLRGANLTGADLTGIDLTQTLLYGAQLPNTELVNVNLTGAQLAATDLSGAHLNGAKLVNVNLSGATLSRADLNGARLSGSNLSGAWLNVASLIGADMVNTDLAGASLIGAEMASADLSDSNLTGAILVGANLAGVNFNGTNLYGAKVLTSELAIVDQIDPVLQELNELQRSQILVDADLAGVTSNGQTIWPNAEMAEVMTADVTESIIEENATLIKVGILHSLSGPFAVSEAPMRDAALLAIQELNAAGGVLGQQVEPIVEDGASDPAIFAERARKLLGEDKVTVIFGGWSSESRKALLPILEEFNALLFYPALYEGFEASPNIFYTGAEPSQQIIPAVDYLVSQGYDSLLLLGSEGTFSSIANALVKAQLADKGLQVVGELNVPTGKTDFSTILSQLSASPPKAIFSTLIGESNINFFTQMKEAGLTATTLPVMSMTLGEEEIRTMGPEALAGHLLAANYFQTVQTPENFDFVNAYKAANGEERTTSDTVVAAYTGIYLWKLLVEGAQSVAADDLRMVAATGTVEFASPGGVVHIDGKTQHLSKMVYIGVIRPDGQVDIVDSSEKPIAPDPFLARYPWAEPVRAMVQAEAAKEEAPATNQ